MAEELGDALDAYAAALNSVPPGPPEELVKRVFNVLIARDRVESVLAGRVGLCPDKLEMLEALDRRLTTNIHGWKAAAGTDVLQRLHRYVQPPIEYWWWYFMPPMNSLATLSMSVLTLLLVAVALSLIADICRRFLTGGADALSVLALVSQALLALFAVSTFTQAGNAWLEDIFARLGILRIYFPQWKITAAMGLLVLTISIRASLPVLARHYNDWGVDLYKRRDTAGALQRLDRAVSLNPDDVRSHYNLAGVLAKTLAYERATAEYQGALYRDSRFFPAYSDLAYMYLAQKSDPAQALSLVETALALEPADSAVRYALFKNRAWANLALHCLHQAEDDAARALSYRKDSAAPHCILAQIREAQGRDPVLEWTQCLGNASQEPVEVAWLAIANERLVTTGAK